MTNHDTEETTMTTTVREYDRVYDIDGEQVGTITDTGAAGQCATITFTDGTTAIVETTTTEFGGLYDPDADAVYTTGR